MFLPVQVLIITNNDPNISAKRGVYDKIPM